MHDREAPPHYRSELQLVTGQSPEDMGSQAEPGNQENDDVSNTIAAFFGLLRQFQMDRPLSRSRGGALQGRTLPGR